MRRRRGFTIVELLVAMALIVFIMVVLSEAFVAALESFRQLKAIGDMDEKMRTATTVLRRDLRADHFGDSVPLSSHSLPPAEGVFRIYHGTPTTPTGPNNFSEGMDGDNIPSTRATDHMLHFTINLSTSPDPQIKVDRRESFLTALVGNSSPLAGYTPPAFSIGDGNYYSQWAEVVYFLRPLGVTASGTPLYALYRRQLLAVPDNQVLNSDPNQRVASSRLDPAPAEAPTWSYYVDPPRNRLWPDYVDVSCKVDPRMPQYLYFNSPVDLTMPIRRFGMLPYDPSKPADPANRQRLAGLLNRFYPKFSDEDPNPADDQSRVVRGLWGADLLLTNVISFEVKVSFGNGILNGEFIDLFHPAIQGIMKNPMFSDPVGPATHPRVFDTWSQRQDAVADYSKSSTATDATRIPLPLNPKALQVTIRVWDERTQKARQVTVVQEM